MVTLAQKRVFVALFALAAIGYFDYTYRLPRLTLLTLTPVLLVVVPAWFVWIRQRPTSEDDRALIVGDDLPQITQIESETELTLLGYLCPTPAVTWGTEIANSGNEEGQPTPALVSDGGVVSTDLTRLGGLSRLEDVLVEHDIDTVILAFAEADRAEFFGALDACYEHGVAAKVHTEHADTVLTAGTTGTPLVDVEIEPWDIQDHLWKRSFDILFSVIGIVTLLPIIVAIAVAIKIEDGGSILYQQERTAVFGETFAVFKFRSMIENAEAKSGVKISEEDEGRVDPRVTRVGRILRQTHLDEIPQLWSVLRGDMSVVGPRPERPELDSEIKTEISDWHKRWFVKPGLTGPAQVSDVTGANPDEKLRYDLLYVREQSLSYDVKMVLRQIWKVLSDVSEAIR